MGVCICENEECDRFGDGHKGCELFLARRKSRPKLGCWDVMWHNDEHIVLEYNIGSPEQGTAPPRLCVSARKGMVRTADSCLHCCSFSNASTYYSKAQALAVRLRLSLYSTPWSLEMQFKIQD
jgi:hypothetical protein